MDAPFFSQTLLAAEMSTLLGELRKIHCTEGVELMLQDLTAHNLLVDDTKPGGGMRLLFADPALAMPMTLLQDMARWAARFSVACQRC
jgi:hypothetical protein